MIGFRESPIIASSIGPKNATDSLSINETVSIYGNGFVEGIIRAFNQNLDLVIRPEDVWQAIISQLSLFIHGAENAELLHNTFYPSKEKVTLDLASHSKLNSNMVARGFASRIPAEVADPMLHARMLQLFSRTTYHDEAVAAFSTMGTMQKHSEYGAMIGGSFPSVTLQGTPNDWKLLNAQVNKLKKYERCKDWVRLLLPIMRYMRKTFDEPDSQEVKDFWLRVDGDDTDMSGDPCKISGWITAFAYFKDDGNVAKDYSGKRLKLDEVFYPVLHPKDIPSSLALIPITILDFEAGVQRFCTAVAGTIGMSISDGGESQPLSKSQPFPAWWIVEEFEESIAVNHNGTMAG
ncbi:hypothetical protein N5P37_006452 [Trichoderma harzianum]|nr:hypothetical protein N5P37_006452 [Trichoderma harzianum]